MTENLHKTSVKKFYTPEIDGRCVKTCSDTTGTDGSCWDAESSVRKPT